MPDPHGHVAAFQCREYNSAAKRLSVVHPIANTAFDAKRVVCTGRYHVCMFSDSEVLFKRLIDGHGDVGL